MEEAKRDRTYCVKECEEKCWRHESNYKFDKNELYSFTNVCIEKWWRDFNGTHTRRKGKRYK